MHNTLFFYNYRKGFKSFKVGGTISCTFCHQVNARLFALLAEAGHCVEAARNAQKEATETREDYHFVAFLLDLENHSVHDVIIVIFF